MAHSSPELRILQHLQWSVAVSLSLSLFITLSLSLCHFLCLCRYIFLSLYISLSLVLFLSPSLPSPWLVNHVCVVCEGHLTFGLVQQTSTYNPGCLCTHHHAPLSQTDVVQIQRMPAGSVC